MERKRRKERPTSHYHPYQQNSGSSHAHSHAHTRAATHYTKDQSCYVCSPYGRNMRKYLWLDQPFTSQQGAKHQLQYCYVNQNFRGLKELIIVPQKHYGEFRHMVWYDSNDSSDENSRYINSTTANCALYTARCTHSSSGCSCLLLELWLRLCLCVLHGYRSTSNCVPPLFSCALIIPTLARALVLLHLTVI